MKKHFIIIAAMLIGGTAQATVKPQQCEKQPVSQSVQVKAEVSQKVEQRVRVRVSQNQKQAQKQQQSQTQANQQTTIYNEAGNLPGLMSAASIDARNPELQQSNVDRMIDAAEGEIMATVGKGYVESYKYSADGVTAVVAHNDSACTVHVYPSGSAKGISPAILDMVAERAAAKIGMRLTLLQKYVSIENHSNGTGASASHAGSAVNQSSDVGGIVGMLTGNRGRTSQRVRIELVYVGQK